MCEVENGVSSQQLSMEIGDQVSRQEVPKTRLGKEAERAVMTVQKTGFEIPPVFACEGARFFVRLTPLATALEELIRRAIVCRESRLNLVDDRLFVVAIGCSDISLYFRMRKRLEWL